MILLSAVSGDDEEVVGAIVAVVLVVEDVPGARAVVVAFWGLNEQFEVGLFPILDDVEVVLLEGRELVE